MSLLAACDVVLARWDLSLCRFAGAALDGLQAHRCCLRGADLRLASLTRPRLRGVDLRHAATAGMHSEERAELTGHTDEVKAVAVSPDGEHVISGSHGHTIKVPSPSVVAL